MNEQPKPNKKPFFYYAMIAMLILMLLNAFVFPSPVSYTHLTLPTKA